ncbi:MAG TPA: DUF1684 domain-containing protein [Chitinophagaceae bacterium]|nr:DUF1684 domain-containing protein [Chitinophagaceae bacterium]
MKYFLFIFFSLSLQIALAQDHYKDSLQDYLNTYVKDHEVVTGSDKDFFRFYPIDKNFRVIATLAPPKDGKWFSMPTSGKTPQIFRVYGILHFEIHDTLVTLNLYQSQNLLQTEKYRDLLFLPFTDQSSGEETYAAGRYIDLTIADIRDNRVILDFNKAYNPYCAYVSGRYNCPIPPRENQLQVKIAAGEKKFGKEHN